MNLIFVPGGIRKGANTSLHHHQVLVIAVVGLLFLPVFFSVLTFKIQGMLDRHTGYADAELLASQRQEIHDLKATLGQTQVHAETHLNALAQRMGRMQAQVLRLNALGDRLTQMAGLDAREFDFTTAPAMGGPESSQPLGSENVNLLKDLADLGQALDHKAEHLAALESLLLDKQLTAAATPSGWPVLGGWVSSHFGIRADPFTGRRAFHEGVDIASRLGSPIKAMGDGVVAHAGPKSGYGLLVEVTHGQGYTTRYAHVSEALVKVGDRITKGQPVAKVGSSGRSTGPHLHFEVHRHGRAVDPRSYLVQK